LTYIRQYTQSRDYGHKAISGCHVTCQNLIGNSSLRYSYLHENVDTFYFLFWMGRNYST